MKKIIPFIAIFLVLFTGCIEIVEKIKVNEDRSGTMTYRIETDEFGTFINMISGMMDESFDDEIKKEFEKCFLINCSAFKSAIFSICFIVV